MRAITTTAEPRAPLRIIVTPGSENIDPAVVRQLQSLGYDPERCKYSAHELILATAKAAWVMVGSWSTKAITESLFERTAA